MMPLALANIGEEYMIRRVSGNPEVKKHLEDLGFTAGGPSRWCPLWEATSSSG